jgi:hypothetical protein
MSSMTTARVPAAFRHAILHPQGDGPGRGLTLPFARSRQAVRRFGRQQDGQDDHGEWLHLAEFQPSYGALLSSWCTPWLSGDVSNLTNFLLFSRPFEDLAHGADARAVACGHVEVRDPQRGTN